MSSATTLSESDTDRMPLARELETVLADRELVVASNREPYRHERVDGEVAVSRPTGGLTAALDPIMQRLGGTWVAWGDGDADAETVDAADRVAVPPDDPAYRLRRLWLDDDRADAYYYGFSNRVLWPLCHGLASKVHFEDRYWTAYRAVNEQFAAAILDEISGPAPVVWLHDYHLGVVPDALREQLPAAAWLLAFWHIPWPAWDGFRRCPRGEALLDGLLQVDVLGFHTDRDRENFVECAQASHDAAYDPATGALSSERGVTHLRTAPLGIDRSQMEARVRSREATARWARLQEDHGLAGPTVALGVDRLDYTKGLEARLDGLETLFERRPDLVGELTYVQKATRSRSAIPAYQAVADAVRTRIERLNRRFGRADWQPVVYRTDQLSPAELAGLYHHADIGLVTPYRDGMNLVAKEYVAAQTADDGVLVLSDLAGASEQLGEHALTVNPYDRSAIAATIARAVDMPAAERHRRMRSLREIVGRWTPTEWIGRLLEPLVTADGTAEPTVNASN